MKKIIVLACFLYVAVAAFSQTEKYSRVKIQNPKNHFSILASNGIAVDEGFYNQKDDSWVTELSATEVNKLHLLGISHDILIDDVTEYYLNRNLNLNTDNILRDARRDGSDYPVPENFTLGTCGGFSTIDECYAHLENMATLWPDLITVKQPVSDLTTDEGRTMYYVKISDNPNDAEDEPQVLYTGMHHAREPIGMQHQLYYMYYLLENYSTNQEIRDLVNSTEMYFIPVVNVDGYARNIQNSPNGGGMWRKNRKNNGDGSYGVDLNRNYGYEWGHDNEGSSPDTWDETYRGPAAFSEKETIMVKEFCEAHQFRIALNYHSYSNLLLYAWGWSGDLTPDEPAFNEYARQMSVDNRYTYGPGYSTIYPSNGGSDDWMYGEQTTKDKILAYTPECGGSNDGFWPSTDRIIPLCQENMIQSLLAARFSGTYGIVKDLSSLIIPELTYQIDFEITRYGQTPADYNISLEPLGDNFESVGDPVIISELDILEKATGSIPFVLNNTVKSGDTIRYVLVLNDGYNTYRDTTERYFGTPIVVFEDDITTIDNWQGQWGLSSVQSVSPPTSMADSPVGNYGNGTNKSTTMREQVSLNKAGVAVLSFYARWDIEAGYDYVQLFISNDNGSTWTPLKGKYTKAGTDYQAVGQPVYDGSSDWVKEEINISEYADDDVKLKFTIRSDAGAVGDGYYFDDLTITIIDRTVDAYSIDPNSSLYFSDGFPNPASDKVNFRIKTGNAKSAFIILSDMQGRVLIKSDNLTGREDYSVNTDELNPGLYVCSFVIDGNIIANRKLTVL